MASPTFLSLRTPLTREQLLTLWSQQLATGQAPFPVTSWEPGSVFPTLQSLGSGTLADLSAKIAAYAAGGYLQTSADPSLQQNGISSWTTLAAADFYNVQRVPAQSTIGPMLLNGPDTLIGNIFGPGDIIVSYSDGISTFEYTNTSTGTFIMGGIQMTFQANSAGSAFNIPNSSDLVVVTATPGLLVTNPAGPSGFWFTVPGTDVESDLSLITRCVNQWATLGTGSPIGAWMNWCFMASGDVRDAFIQPTGLGTVAITVYSQNAPVSAGGLIAIRDYVSARLPLGSLLAPGSPRNAATATLTFDMLVVYGPASANPLLQGTSPPTGQGIYTINTALALMCQNTPVGGYTVNPGSSTTQGISRSTIEAVIEDSIVIQGSKVLTRIDTAVTGATPEGNFLMPPSSGVPTVAALASVQSLLNPNPAGVVWINI